MPNGAIQRYFLIELSIYVYCLPPSTGFFRPFSFQTMGTLFCCFDFRFSFSYFFSVRPLSFCFRSSPDFFLPRGYCSILKRYPLQLFRFPFSDTVLACRQNAKSSCLWNLPANLYRLLPRRVFLIPLVASFPKNLSLALCKRSRFPPSPFLFSFPFISFLSLSLFCPPEPRAFRCKI